MSNIVLLQCSSKRGFSLIQMSILVVVAGIVLAAVVPGGKWGDYNQKIVANTAKLDAVESAMMVYMSKHGHRPCPASGAYKTQDTNFGWEAGISAVPQDYSTAYLGSNCTSGAVTAPLTDGANIVAGMIPTKSLNLTDDYAFDAWGRPFTYVVDKRTTIAFGTDTNNCYNMQRSGTQGGITINTTGGTLVDKVMVAYISYGTTGHGAFPPQGSTAANRIDKGITDADMVTNAGSASPLSSTFSTTLIQKNKTATFDDIVYYRKDTMNTCFTGNGSIFSTLAGYRFDGSANDMAGSSLAVGDINGDGIDDLIVGAPNAGKGHVYVIFGSPYGFDTATSYRYTLSSLTNLTHPAGFMITGISNNDKFGASVAVGDVNGDGYKDIIVGAPGFNGGTNQGAVYVIFGHSGNVWNNLTLVAPPANPLDGTHGFVINGAAASDKFGTSVAAGNLRNHIDNPPDNSRIQDLIVGAPGFNGGTNIGTVYVVYGNSSALPSTWGNGSIAASGSYIDGTKGVRIDNNDPEATTGLAGTSVAAGDVNGDGLDDLLIGAPNAVTSSGKVYVEFGSTITTPPGAPLYMASLTGNPSTYGLMIKGINGSHTGTSVASGDVNGDGISDIIIGAPNAAPQTRSNAGSTYVILGSTSLTTSPLNLSNTYPSATTNPPTGFRVDGSAGETSGTFVGTGCSPTGSGTAALLIGAPAPCTSTDTVNCDNSSTCYNVSPTGVATVGSFARTYNNSYVVYGEPVGTGYSKNGFLSTQNLCTMDANNGTPLYMNGFYAASGFGLLNEKIGASMATVDLHQTGKCAVVVGAPAASGNAGYVFVILGKSSFNQSFYFSTLR